jgi:hypothetical protein
MITEGSPAAKKFDAVLLDRLGSWTYPYADERGVMLAADWMGWFFAFDDILDDTAAGRDQWQALDVAEVINSVYLPGHAAQPHTKPELAPYRDAMADLWKRTVVGTPIAWRHRFAYDLAEYLDSYRTQAIINSDPESGPLGVDAYRMHRLSSSAVYVSLDIGEAVGGHPIPGTLAVHPDIRIARHCANNVVSWVNDLFSGPKELSLVSRDPVRVTLCRPDGAGQRLVGHQLERQQQDHETLADSCNYIAVLAHHEYPDLTNAASAVADAVAAQTDRFLAADARIRHRLLPRISDREAAAVIHLLDVCAAWMNGNAVWSAESARYANRAVAEAPAAPTHSERLLSLNS